MSENYLIEIIAQLRDEASSKIRDLQRAVDELKASAAAGDATGGLRQGLSDTADEAERAAQAHKELQKQQQQGRNATRQSEADVKNLAHWQEQAAEETAGHAASTEELRRQQQAMSRESRTHEASVQRIAQQHTGAAESVAQHATSHEDLASSLRDANDAMKRVQAGEADLGGETKKLQERVDEALNSFDELSKSFREGSGDLKQLRQDLSASGKELDVLSRRFETFDTNAQMLRNLSEEAKSMAKNLDTLQASSRQPILNNLGLDKAKQDLEGLTRQFNEFNRTVENAQSDQARLTNRLFATRFGAVARALPVESLDFSSAIEQQARAQSLSRAQRTAAPRDFRAEGEQMISKMRQLDSAARNHVASNAELAAGYSRLASGLRRVWTEMEVGSVDARKFGDAMEEAGRKAKNLDLARSSSGIGRMAQQIAAATDSIGIKIISLSAALRGARLAGLVGLFQPIVTGLASLAGGFFNVASGAAQAAATIGGVFISGLGQMIPMMSIATAALVRLRDIFQAVQAAQAAKQEAFFQPFQGLITQLQNTNQLIEAQQQLTNSYYTLQDAQVQVKESQIQLTQARIDAIRNLQDLVLAERSAELQLKEANLSVVQARQQLIAAQASGSQMAIQQAQLQLQGATLQQQQARLGVPRSQQNLRIALSYGVAGAPGVLAATEAYRQSLLGVKEAEQGIAAAQRQMRITQLQLAQPASHMTQQQATLQYLLGQMSSPEKALFHVINNIENQLRSPNSPLKKLSDYIIEPFTYAFQRLDSLLGNKSFMTPITKLAQTMGGGLQSVFKTMFGPRGTSFFETMARDATNSIPVVTKAITGLMKVFEDIATAAAPAFKQLSQDWANFWDKLDKNWRTPKGQKALTDFFNKGAKWAEDFAHLAGAIASLLGALGHQAAPQGMTLVSQITEAVKDATTWVKNHGAEVSNFFAQARQGFLVIGALLIQIGTTLIQVFSLKSLQAFADFISKIVLPVVRDVVNAIGFLVRNMMNLVDQFGPAKGVIEGIVGAFTGLLIINRVIGMVTRTTTAFRILAGVVAGFRTAEGGIFSKLAGAFKGGSLAAQGIKVDASGMNAAAVKMQTAADTFAGAAEKMSMAAGTQDAAAAKMDTAAAEQEVASAERSPGGIILPSGVTPAEAGAGGVTTEEAALAGGGGLALGIGGATLATGGLAALLTAPLWAPYAIKGIESLFSGPHVSRGYTPNSLQNPLGALLGPVGAQRLESHYGHSRFGRYQYQTAVGIQSAGTAQSIRTLQKQLYGVTDPSQLSTQQLIGLQNEIAKVSAMPDLTKKQRAGLQQLSDQLSIANSSMQKASATWSATFQGINVTTGNVMQQVNQTLSQNISAISANLGTGTKAGAQALVATFYSAWQTVLNNTSDAVRGTAAGIRQIDQMLGATLKAMGVNAPPGLTRSLAAGLAAGNQQAQLNTGAILSQGSLLGSGSGNIYGGLADGGWHTSRPGGRIVAEGGHDEVTLTTDPAKAPRQRRLLAQYLRRAPHMATGGYVNPIPGFSLGRTDMGVDANAAPGTPIGAIGLSKLVSVIPNWYQGQPLLDFQLLSGADAGRYWYVAEQISPVTEKIGSVFQPGQMVARYAPSGTGIEIGWAGNANGATLAQAMGNTGGSGHSNAPAGAAFRTFLGGLAKGQILGGIPGIQQIIAPHVAGVAGAMGAIAQGVVNQIAGAANQYLGQIGGGSAPAVGGLSGSIKTMVNQLSLRFGWGGPQIQDWLNVIGAESGGNPNAVNPSSGAYGIGQFLGSTLREYAKYGATSHNAANQLYAMAMYIRDRYMNPASAWAHEQAYHWYAVGGLLGRHLRRMGVRHLRRHVLRFADGGRAPWGGEPVPIIAHEGERISNPAQWGEIARMAGTTPAGLDHHLGYDTGHPRQSFAPGGTIRAGQGYNTYGKTNSLSAINTFLGSLVGNLYTLDPGSLLGAFGALSHLVQAITAALGDISKLPIKKQTDKLTTLIENFADPNNPASTLNLLTIAFQRFQNNISAWVTSLGYRVRPVSAGGIAQVHGGLLHGSGFGGVSLGGPALTAGNIGQTGQTTLDALNVRASVEQTQFLHRESQSITKAIHGVRNRMKAVQYSHLSKKTKKDTLAQLQSAYTELIQQQENLNSAINSQISTTFQNEQTYIQDTLNQVNDIYQTSQQQIQAQQATAQAKGQYGNLGAIDRALINNAKAQIDALQQPLQEAQRTGNADLVAQIQQQIAQLQQTIGETTAQMIQDAISGIQQTAQTSQARVSMLQTISQTMQQSAGSPGAIAAAFGVNAQALQLNQANLQSQLQGYNSLLGQAIATGNQGAVATLTQTIDSLTAQLAQNEQAIQDNTAQMISAESQFTQARGSFQTGTLGGLAQVVQTIGQTTGFTNVPLLRALVTGQNNVLGGTQGSLLGQLSQLGGGASGLASSLMGAVGNPMLFAQILGSTNLAGIESGQDAQWISTFESLIGNLTQNTEAIAQNNQQLAQLNGMLLQPQQWSTTTWQAFRNAIFSGMGNLLPQYQATLPPGSAPSIAPIFSGVAGGGAHIENLNINHAPTTTLEPRILGEQLAYEVSNAVG